LTEILGNNNSSSEEVKKELVEVRKLSFSSLKNILSYYLMEDNFIFEFKSKNKLFLFESLKDSDKILRIKKFMGEYEEWGLKKIKSNIFCSFFEDLTDKKRLENFNNIILFYENLMEINKKEYQFLSSNTTTILNKFQQKFELMHRLLENYLNFSEFSYCKLKVL